MGDVIGCVYPLHRPVVPGSAELKHCKGYLVGVNIQNAVRRVGFAALGATGATLGWLYHDGSFPVWTEPDGAVGVADVAIFGMWRDRHGGAAYGGRYLAKSTIAAKEDVTFRKGRGDTG